MYPTIFHIPILNIPIYGFGLMMVAAFLSTQWLASRLAKSKGLDPEIFVNVALIALVAGVVGARASDVLENLKDFTNHGLWNGIVDAINIRSGGLTFYGGLILAAPIVLGYLMYRKVTPRLAMDICAPCITLGLAIGRMGCFLNGCCYGADANVPWAVSFPYYSNAYNDQFDHRFNGKPGDKLNHEPPTELVSIGEDGRMYPRSPSSFVNNPSLVALAGGEHSNAVHPTQLYSTITSLLLTALLLCYFFLPHTGGRVFALMLMLEGPSRFLLEMLRVEPPVIGNLSLSMVIGMILLVIGVVLWIALGAVKDKTPAFQSLQWV